MQIGDDEMFCRHRCQLQQGGGFYVVGKMTTYLDRDEQLNHVCEPIEDQS